MLHSFKVTLLTLAQALEAQRALSLIVVRHSLSPGNVTLLSIPPSAQARSGLGACALAIRSAWKALGLNLLVASISPACQVSAGTSQPHSCLPQPFSSPYSLCPRYHGQHSVLLSSFLISFLVRHLTSLPKCEWREHRVLAGLDHGHGHQCLELCDCVTEWNGNGNEHSPDLGPSAFQTCAPECTYPLGVGPRPHARPSRGEIMFTDYQMRYRDNTPLVLDGLNLNIQSRGVSWRGRKNRFWRGQAPIAFLPGCPRASAGTLVRPHGRVTCTWGRPAVLLPPIS